MQMSGDGQRLIWSRVKAAVAQQSWWVAGWQKEGSLFNGRSPSGRLSLAKLITIILQLVSVL